MSTKEGMSVALKEWQPAFVAAFFGVFATICIALMTSLYSTQENRIQRQEDRAFSGHRANAKTMIRVLNAIRDRSEGSTNIVALLTDGFRRMNDRLLAVEKSLLAIEGAFIEANKLFAELEKAEELDNHHEEVKGWLRRVETLDIADHMEIKKLIIDILQSSREVHAGLTTTVNAAHLRSAPDK